MFPKHCTTTFKPNVLCLKSNVFLMFLICSASGNGVWKARAFMAIWIKDLCDVNNYITTT